MRSAMTIFSFLSFVLAHDHWTDLQLLIPKHHSCIALTSNLDQLSDDTNLWGYFTACHMYVHRSNW